MSKLVIPDGSSVITLPRAGSGGIQKKLTASNFFWIPALTPLRGFGRDDELRHIPEGEGILKLICRPQDDWTGLQCDCH